jgi:hypothetical protein
MHKQSAAEIRNTVLVVEGQSAQARKQKTRQAMVANKTSNR